MSRCKRCRDIQTLFNAGIWITRPGTHYQVEGRGGRWLAADGWWLYHPDDSATYATLAQAIRAAMSVMRALQEHPL